MPIIYSISERESLVLIRPFGSVTTRELLSLISSVSSDPDFLPGMSVLLDCTEVKSVMLVTGLREVAIEVGKLTEKTGSRIAVAAPDGFVYGLGRAFAAYGEFFGVKAGIFRTIEEACLWLDVSGEPYNIIDFESRRDYCFVQ